MPSSTHTRGKKASQPPDLAEEEVEEEVDFEEEEADDHEEDEEDENQEGEQLPNIDDPYTVLDVAQDATDDQIKRAYRKLSLKHHPDKASGADAATAKEDFQRLTAAYAVLSDPRRRSRFDTTGDTSEAIFVDDETFSWQEFYKQKFADVVTEHTINEFAGQYKGSDEERRDVLATFTKVKGKMERLFQTVMLSDMEEDEVRFRVIIDEAISNGQVEAYPAYANESENERRKRLERVRKEKERESKEAATELKKDKGADRKRKKDNTESLGALAAMIRGRQESRGASLLDSLEARYGGGARKKGGKKMDEPPESAFEANRAKRSRR